MLILTRRPSDTLLIDPHPDIDDSHPSAWFARPIEVRILRIEGNPVRIGVEAAEGCGYGGGEGQ